MADFKAMGIGELEAHREGLQEKIESLQAEFVEAGKVLNEKRLQTPKAKALSKAQEAQAELDALTAEASAEGAEADG